MKGMGFGEARDCRREDKEERKYIQSTTVIALDIPLPVLSQL
jgi:hypothetical protein